jgi:hypothetical protein
MNCRIPKDKHVTVYLAKNVIIESLDSIPKDAQTIICGNSFNEPLDLLPPSITSLSINEKFNHHPLINLPPLLHLSLPYSITPSSLPPSITNLTLMGGVLGDLPPNLTILHLEHRFIYSVDRLPSSLSELSLGPGFSAPVDNLPSSLTKLKFGTNFFTTSHLLLQN